MTDEDRAAFSQRKRDAARDKRTQQMREYRAKRRMNPEAYEAHKARERDRMRRYNSDHKDDPLYQEARKGYARKAARTGLMKIRQFLAVVKVSRGCADCGYNTHPAALQFDHVRGVKLFTISCCQNIKDIELEIEKCDVVCSNCHHIRTYNRMNEEMGREDHLMAAVEHLRPPPASSLP